MSTLILDNFIKTILIKTGENCYFNLNHYLVFVILI